MKRKVLKAIGITAVLTLAAVGCGKTESTTTTEAAAEETQETASETEEEAEAADEASAEVQTITIGIRQDLYPTSYIDEDGNPSGYDVEIARLIDEALPEYEFTYDAVSQDNLLLGLDTGKYAAGFAGYFWNEDRAEKYLFPEENIGGSVVGLVTTKEHSDLTGWGDIADQGLTLCPLAGTSGIYPIIREYNDANPDRQVTLEVTEWKTDAEGYQWVLDGRYDVCAAENTRYDTIKAQIDTDDRLVYIPVTSIKTWTLFAQGQEEFVTKYDEILKQLKEDGTASALSVEYFGTDVLQYD